MSEGSSEVIPRAVVCCPLCAEEFKQPKILPCLHVYCQDCIQGHIAKTTPDDASCPECKTSICQDTGCIPTLADHFFIRRLSDPIKIQHDGDSVCHRCSAALTGSMKAKSGAYKCVNCDEYLCSPCTQLHQEENETSSHKVEKLDPRADAPRQDSFTNKTAGSSLPKCCTYYDPLEVGALFCVNCEMLTCAKCCAKSHSNHRCAELSAVAANFENKVDEPLLDLEDNTRQLSEHLSILCQAKEDLLTKQKKLQDLVTKRKDFLADMLENYAQTAMAEIDRQFEQNLADIELQRQSTQHHISSINAVLDFTDNLLAYGTDEEKVSQRKRIGGRIRELSEIEIPDDVALPADVVLRQPEVTVEFICDLFGELTTAGLHTEQQYPLSRNQTSIDSGHFSEVNGDLTDLGASFDGRQSPSGKVRRKSVQFDTQVSQTNYETDHIFHLDDPIREFAIPTGIQRDCIKGMGINNNGDIIIGAVYAEGQCIYIVEKRGIIRGKVPVEKGWQLHSVASDGKVSMVVNRGNNRHKVCVLKDDCSGQLVEECQIHSYGINFITADSRGQVILASNRYGKVCGSMGKSAKSGGNIAVHDKTGHLLQRITNENYVDFNLYVLEKPCSVAVDSLGNLFVADAGSHLVAGFSSAGDLLFTFGNSDTNGDENYEGPDCVALDNSGNLIVTDRRANRIDILSSRGQLLKTFYTNEPPKFVAAGLDKQIMVATPDGIIKFYEYL